MKNILLISLIICFYSCEKKSDQYFISDEINTAILGSIQNENIENKDLKYFYVFTRYDTLFVLATAKENEIFPIDRINKLGAFKYDNNKVIIAESYNPKYNIIRNDASFDDKFIKETKNIGSFDEDIQYGYIFKMKNPHNVNLIKKGKLKEFFIK